MQFYFSLLSENTRIVGFGKFDVWLRLTYQQFALQIGLGHNLLRKEVIQPHLPIRLPCYDFTPVIGFTFDSSLLTVK